MQNEKIFVDWVRCPVCGNKTRDKIRDDFLGKRNVEIAHVEGVFSGVIGRSISGAIDWNRM